MDSFDFVIVGAGTAGSVLAARLSEDPYNRVLLVEGGAPTGPPAMSVPAAWPTLIGSEVDWGYATVPQRGLDHHVLPYPRGKVYGGSSSINAMAFLRGHRDNYDEWARGGATGWGYDDLLPYFKRSETAAPGRDPYYRGTSGPMRVAPAPRVNEISYAYHAAAIQAGHPVSEDLNGKQPEGVAWLEMNIVDGLRQSAADGYLRPILGRANLTVVPNAVVRRLTFAGDRCTGIEYVTGGRVVQARADREVVLSAGAVGTPKLLLISGIGPAHHLRERGLWVRTDLPGVGSGLQDHPLSGITYAAAKPVPAAINNHSDLVSQLRSRPGLVAPDVQITFMDIAYYPPGTTGPAQGYTIVFSLMRPHSRGTVRLASDDPAAAPLIDPNFLSDRRDVETMVAALRLAREAGETPAMSEWRGAEAIPGPETDSDEALARYVRSTVSPFFHAAGTCRIGTDSLAVVDPQLRVHGVQGLRVADASVMPALTGANPNATVYAIGEKASALLLQ
ncbi:choline dehydrogenase [Actinoplanes sp. TBRC 11911]|uniref:GMC family oxidoreductase n=1 Tax=Actinoplanes sp. TBRC 11911 TaxID=2729386 RepID=UPI00145E76C6|nr:GMC family oxidoreductase N-terminal domain-containing protein [Actinoplanes sp. TBRC 11911]NMO51648.1 choline dehydrogenase [Actinoplanes sp. TBRC 11911]